jgi:NTE family protein
MRFFWQKKKVGLALSGGVARGMAHIGVLKSLKKHNIPIDFIAGTSAGALAGVFYAAGWEPDDIEKLARRLNWFNYVRFGLTKFGPASTEELQKLIRENLGDIRLEELEIPFAAVSCDIKTGREVILTEGNAAFAMAASCAFPGFYTPLRHGSDLLVDGGIVDNLPVKVVKDMGAHFTIAVDVVPGHPLKHDPENVAHMLGRTWDLFMRQTCAESRKQADVLIEPDIPENIWHLDIDKTPKLIKVGEEAAEARIFEIRAKLLLKP